MISSRHPQLQRLIVVATFLLLPFGHGFLPQHQQQTRSSILRGSNNGEEEPDLFDYFDPLRSPHDYPDGIGPDHKPQDRSKDDVPESSEPKIPMGFDLMQSEFPSAFVGMEELKEEDETPKNKFASPNKQPDEELDLFDVFDPTLSPHAYPNGIPSTKKSEQQRQKVGILLMDHGSRNEASNQRLHDLARLYQNSLGAESGAIVKAVHMEIASPSIPDGLQALVDLGVSEIVCHPFFLSPGRHVKKDIPEIVETAIEELNIDIPVTTTPQLGSHTDLMLTAIHSLVEESSAVLSQQKSKSGKFGF